MSDNTLICDVQAGDLPQISSDVTVLKEVAATAVMELLQSVGMPISDITTANDLVTTFVQQQQQSSGATVVVEQNLPVSDSVVTLDQATSNLVNRVGDFITKAGTSDEVPAALLMQDVQELWKRKTPADTVASTAATVWNSIKTSEHLPVIAGMIASLFVKKK
jgi:hypothetical protein